MGLKVTCICLDGALCKVYAVSFLLKSFSGFIEPNMSVSANSQKLHVNAAYAADRFIIVCTCFVTVFFQSVRYISSCLINIYMVKQIGVHKIAIALVIIS